MSWQPLFPGTAAEPYQRTIDAIVSALDTREIDELDCGRPLLHAYLAKARSSPADFARAESLVDRLIELMGSRILPSALYGGFAGVGWLAAHFDSIFARENERAHGNTDAHCDSDEITEALLLGCAQRPSQYDLISGLVGFGVYFLERLPCPRAIEGLSRVTGALDRSAERFDDEVTWWTPPFLLAEYQRKMVPKGCYNLGVAHGVPGIIGLLSEMRRARVSTPKADELLAGSIRWVLNRKLPGNSFPSWFVPGLTPMGSRLGWCYGELGVSVTLLLAARAIGDGSLEHMAVDIALASSQRRGNDAGANDACLCHGAAGNAHLYNRLFQATGRPEFRDAAIFWFDRALKMRTDGIGVAGYRAWKPMTIDGQRSEQPWQDDESFLSGASGIALALLAATTAVEPQWDRVLLCGVTRAQGVGRSDTPIMGDECFENTCDLETLTVR